MAKVPDPLSVNDVYVRVAAVIMSQWPAPWFDGPRQYQQVADMAIAVTKEVCQTLSEAGAL